MEMGGLDGIKFSNTYFFNMAPGIGWKGVLVELGPKNFAKLIKNRPNELATVHAAVCDHPRTVHYVEVERSEVSGIWEFAAQSFRDNWWKGLTIDNALPITCLPLQEILDTHLSNEKLYFDFFSLDVEGAEFEVLQTLDYERVGFGVICCEADEHDELKNLALRAFLSKKGYIFLENRGRSWWFVNGQFDRIYSTLLR
jgi:FkbM family methyltransferase